MGEDSDEDIDALFQYELARMELIEEWGKEEVEKLQNKYAVPQLLELWRKFRKGDTSPEWKAGFLKTMKQRPNLVQHLFRWKGK